MGTPNPVDIHVGSRVRLRRILLGMSQEKVGNALGLTFQQIQKYEKGANRIGSSRLFKLSNLLGVPVTYFFDDMPDNLVPNDQNQSGRNHRTFNQSLFSAKETLELVRNYYKIRDQKLRKKIFELLKGIAQVEK